jgi:UDP-N-acetyl-D-mannosaminuronic acid dehydrogenase
MNINIIGLGYVGLPTAVLFASKGIKVIGVDINPKIINKINTGNAHIVEPGLQEMLRTIVNSGYLKAVSIPQPADVFIIAVPTPITKDKLPDLNAFESALRSIAPFIQKGNLIIIESTVPLKTTKNAAYTLSQMRADLTFPLDEKKVSDISIAYCPERVLPGDIIRELVETPRIIGGLNEASAHYAAEVYRLFCKRELILTDALTAEMIKLTENSYRDVSIAFANEISMLCDEYKINAREVIELANHHPRVNILNPGSGVGGHCIPIDPWFIVSTFPEKARLIRMAREVNDAKTEYIFQQILDKAKNDEKYKIAILGISYKANVEDIRESPAIKIINKLINSDNLHLYITDPYVEKLPEELERIESINFVSLEEAILLADIIVILTGHDQYKSLKDKIFLANKYIIDTTGITDVSKK